MGCFESKAVYDDNQPNLFQVSNLNEAGTTLWSGQLEVTRGALLLHRKGHDPTVWPFDSLRRYGNQADVFSFESGRRCTSGEGIFAFRSGRANQLLLTLLQNIELRKVMHDCLPYQIQTPRALTLSRHTLPGNVQLHSYDAGHSGTRIRTSRSMPGHTGGEMLQLMPLNPMSKNVAHRYLPADFKSQEHNNNHHGHGAVSSEQHNINLNRDLAMLRNSLHVKTAINNMRDLEDENEYLMNRYYDEKKKSNEDYAEVTMGPDPNNIYMNVTLGPSTSHSPLTTERDGSMTPAPRKSLSGELQIRYNDSDVMLCRSPNTQQEVNYAILDIDRNRDESICRALVSPDPERKASGRASRQSRRHTSDSSAEHGAQAPPAVGYTTIDFERTEALTSLVNDNAIDDERRARHDSTDRFDYRRH